MAYPLRKHVKIGAFWQDIVYENLPILCYQCGRRGHREVVELKVVFPSGPELLGEQGMMDPEHPHTPWKTVQTWRSKPCGTNTKSHPRGKLLQRDTHSPINQYGFTASTKSHVMSNQQAGSVIGQAYEESWKTAGFN